MTPSTPGAGPPLVIDGSLGEGGGQVLRSSLTLSLLTGRPVRVERVRAGRERPGLAAQHLTAVRAAAAVCDGEVAGDELGSRAVELVPGPVRAGEHRFDVGAAREGGSAGAATLVIQTVLLPLALALGGERTRSSSASPEGSGAGRRSAGVGDSALTVVGGTHMRWSPVFDYLAAVWLPALADMGVDADVELGRFGFFPVGKGEIRLRVRSNGREGEGSGGAIPTRFEGNGDAERGDQEGNLGAAGDPAGEGGGAAGGGDHGCEERGSPRLLPLERVERGELLAVNGRALAAELPSHIPQRMADRARSLLVGELGGEGDGPPAEVRVEPQRVRAACAGAAIFLAARYRGATAGFTAHGRIGKPSETVAGEAVDELLAFHRAPAAVDAHLADQLLLPAAFASGPSTFTTERATRHLTTQAELVERFEVAAVRVNDGPEGTARVTVEPASPPASE